MTVTEEQQLAYIAQTSAPVRKLIEEREKLLREIEDLRIENSKLREGRAK